MCHFSSTILKYLTGHISIGLNNVLLEQPNTCSSTGSSRACLTSCFACILSSSFQIRVVRENPEKNVLSVQRVQMHSPQCDNMQNKFISCKLFPFLVTGTHPPILEEDYVWIPAPYKDQCTVMGGYSGRRSRWRVMIMNLNTCGPVC